MGVFQDSSLTAESSQRLCTVDAQFSLLLRISHQYGKQGSQILLSMGVLQSLSSCNLMGVQKKVAFVCKCNYMFLWIHTYNFVYYQGNSRAISNIIKERAGEIDKKKSLIAPVLRIVTSFTSLVDSADFLEVSWFWVAVWCPFNCVIKRENINE